MSKVKDMTVGSPTKLILSFALPLIITNLGQQLYMIVDSAIVGRGVGVKALAAVGATDWSYWLVLWTVQALTQGFATYVAQYFGKKDKSGLNKVIAMSVELCVVFGILITAAGVSAARPLLKLLQTPPDIYDGAVTYLTTMIAGTLIVMAYNMAAAILRAFGNGKTPLIAMCVAAVLNILLDLLFVLYFGLGIFGAALATLIAQFVSFIYCLFEIRKLEYVQLSGRHFTPDFSMISTLCRFGLPLALQNILIGASGMAYQSSINLQGSVFVAGSTANNKVFGLLESSSLSLGFASTTFTAQNYGAGDAKRMKDGVKASIKIVVVLAFIIMALIALFGEYLLQAFINPTETDADMALQIGNHFLKIVSYHMVVLYLLNIFRAIIQGFGNSVCSMLSGVLESIVRVLVSKWGLLLAGTEILYFAEPLSWIFAAAFIISAYFVVRKKYYAVCSKELNQS